MVGRRQWWPLGLGAGVDWEWDGGISSGDSNDFYTLIEVGFTQQEQNREKRRKNTCMCTQIYRDLSQGARVHVAVEAGKSHHLPSAIQASQWCSSENWRVLRARGDCCLSSAGRQAGKEVLLLIQTLCGFPERCRRPHTHTPRRPFCFTPSTAHWSQCSSHLETASQHTQKWCLIRTPCVPVELPHEVNHHGPFKVCAFNSM